jgi:hypothetical protein
MNLSPKHSPKLKKFFTLIDLKRDYISSSVPTFIMLANTQGYSAVEQATALLYLSSTLPEDHKSKGLIFDELLQLPASAVVESLCHKKYFEDHESVAIQFIDSATQQLPEAKHAKEKAILELSYIIGSRYPDTKTVEKFCEVTASAAARKGFYMPLAAVACNIVHCGQELAAQGAKKLHSLLAKLPTPQGRITALDEALTQLPKDPVSYAPLLAVTKKLAKKMPDPRDKAELILRVASHMHKADPRVDDSFVKLFLEITAENYAQGFTALHDVQKEIHTDFARLFFIIAAVKSPIFPTAQATDVLDYLAHRPIWLTKPQKIRIRKAALENLRTQPQTSGPAAHFRKLLMVHMLGDGVSVVHVSADEHTKLEAVFNQIGDTPEKTGLARDCVSFAIGSKQENTLNTIGHWLPYANYVANHHHGLEDTYTRFNALIDTCVLSRKANQPALLNKAMDEIAQVDSKLHDLNDRDVAWTNLYTQLGEDIAEKIKERRKSPQKSP